MSDQEIMSLKGTNGTIAVYEDRVVIKRKGLFAYLTQGIKGDSVFFYKNLSGIDFKKPGAFNGYIRFVTAGTAPYDSKTGLLATPRSQGDDPNTVILRAINPKIPRLSEELYQFILKKIADVQAPSSRTSSETSEADEILKFKALLDQGIITQEEFESKKKQLLGIE